MRLEIDCDIKGRYPIKIASGVRNSSRYLGEKLGEFDTLILCAYRVSLSLEED